MFEIIPCSLVESVVEARARISMLRYKSSSVPVKDIFELRVPIPFPSAVLKYSFGTDKYDINFSLLFESARGDCVVLLPERRVNSNVQPHCGEHIFTAAGGFVIFVFDNNYSWWRTKALSYMVSLEPPNQTKLRELKSQNALKQLLRSQEDIQRATRRKARLTSEATELREDRAKLQGQLDKLQDQLKAKSRTLADLEKEDAWLTQRIQSQKSRTIPALVMNLAQEWLDGSERSHNGGT